MEMNPIPGLKRDYPKLIGAMSEVLQALRDDTGEDDALRRSFHLAVDGFQAGIALLILVRDPDAEPPVLSVMEQRGLTTAQVAQVEKGESILGVSVKLIRGAIKDGVVKRIENPFFLTDAQKTHAFAEEHGKHFSAICAPIRDINRTRAVMYFCNVGQNPFEAYQESDAAWLEDYAAALGQVFSLVFYQQQRLEELAQQEGSDAPDMIGDSSATQKLRRLLHEVYLPMTAIQNPEPILIVGETGTGKEVVARYLHAYGSRAGKPFTVVNCYDIQDSLATARFSGHVRGAFTGAERAEPGYFRASDGGVIFLDEIGDLSEAGQGALMRAIDNRTVQPVGDTKTYKFDVLILLATNKNLETLVQQGKLKHDFYRRIATNRIELKPLRERPWDVPPLAAHFLRYWERRAKKKTLGFTEDALRAMAAYNWPGNVREIRTLCSKIVFHARPSARLDRATLLEVYPELGDRAKLGNESLSSMTLEEATNRFQRDLIFERIELFEGNRERARESLGMPPTTFRRYLRNLDIADDAGESQE